MFLVTSLAWFIAVRIQAAELSIMPGPFQPTMESLTNYSCPEWFRNAKFGIWAHWGPQAVPMEGDWYAVSYTHLDVYKRQVQQRLVGIVDQLVPLVP